MSPNPELDPYTTMAENTDITPQQKIDGSCLPSSAFPLRHGLRCVLDLKKVIKNAQTSMLTTRSRDGDLHSRAMAPTSASASFCQLVI